MILIVFWKKILPWIVAVPLGVVATFFLLNEADAHVSMCMVCAIGYSVSLILRKPEEIFNKLASFFAGGILFYTIYSGSTMMYFEWFENFLWEPESWLYHILINPAILVLFFTKKDRVEYIWRGIEIFMITSPIMLVINQLTGRRLWDWEIPQVIALYVIGGFILLAFHQVIIKTKVQAKAWLWSRWFIIFSLVFYTLTLLVMIPFSKGINRPSNEYPPSPNRELLPPPSTADVYKQ